MNDGWSVPMEPGTDNSDSPASRTRSPHPVMIVLGLALVVIALTLTLANPIYLALFAVATVAEFTLAYYIGPVGTLLATINIIVLGAIVLSFA